MGFIFLEKGGFMGFLKPLSRRIYGKMTDCREKFIWHFQFRMRKMSGKALKTDNPIVF